MKLAFATAATVPIGRSGLIHLSSCTPIVPKPVHARSITRPSIVAVATTESTTDAETKAFDAVVMGTYTRYNIVLTHGEGATLYDIEGKSYIDGAAGIATCTLGHAHKGLQQAVSEQLGKLTHVSNLYYTTEQRYLANWLVENSPGDKAFFCNSGGEANEAAIKLVRRYWHNNHPGRENDVPVIICAKNAFHGRTLATITATGQPKYQRGFWPLMPGFLHCTYNDVESLRECVNMAGDRLAGIMLEAMQGEGGVNPGTKQFFAAAREICNEKDALLVCDEVQVGVGRTGRLWGFQNVDVEPDVFTLAKGLAGGVPVGAMVCKDICNVFGPGDHASTFGGNLLACAAGRVVADSLDSGLLEQVRARGEYLGEKLETMASELGGAVKETRGWGLIRGVELSEQSGLQAGTVVGECIKRGLLLVPAGTKVVRLVPPLIISEDELNRAVDILKQVISEQMKE